MTTPFGGIATAIGSWPGTDSREAAATIVGELGEMPHIVELPARGVGADMIGRAGALLVDMHFDTTTRGYRLARTPGSVAKRSLRLLREDLDLLEEAWEKAGYVGTGKALKLQACGPLTLAAEVELGNGHRVLTDDGAVRDFAESLAEGLAQHVAEVQRRFGAKVVLQLDEPSLPAVIAGTVKGVTGMDRVAALPAPNVLHLLDLVVEAAQVPVLVHNCGASPPLELLRRSKAECIGVDAALLQVADLDGIGELLEAGKAVALGLVPAVGPDIEPTWRDIANPALNLVDRLGFKRSTLRDQILVTPGCGLAAASNSWARKALRLSVETARAFAEEPESL
ncbi:methionine synthase [Antrihabitans sp. YC2-6]|uniref:methionine synthase n=1 Tax=Antrihabitans sp. YC2-6 TaxID=2799498 RepID=UPI0018F49340|nr:methionine synthase [Antrihabitans sp. YC2-6]MBJ8343443.1 methionine synthase [Antrihabitans sp. YC2-6]